MMSAFRASRLRAVSLSVSPFLSDDASVLKLITSAVSRWAASSKLMRERVDGSTKRLTRVLPRKRGTFLIARSPTALKARAVSSTVTISSAESDSISSRCLRVQVMRTEGCSLWVFAFDNGQSFLVQAHFVFPVRFLETHVDFFAERGRNIFAHEIGLDRQIAMSAIDQHGELHAAGAAEIVQRIEGGAGGPAAEENVVHQH